MVPVKKPIIAGKSPKAAEPQKRRPRNQELNSSKKVSRLAAAVQNRCLSLNSSRSYDGYEYEDITVAQLAEESQVPVADLEGVLKSLESEYGCNVTGILVSADREAEKEYDGKDIVVQTDCGDFYWGEDKFIPVNSSTDLDMNCSDDNKSSEVGTVTIYNDFADLNIDEVEALIKDRVKKMSPNCSVSVEKLNDTELKISLNGTDEDVTQGRLAVESSDVTKSVDWEHNLDSGCHGEKMNSSENSDEANPSEKDEASVNCSEEDLGTIYTESGNEVAITDIKVVQNPETNALALFVPENGDDEIPEGFAVIGDVIATASGAPAIEENAETGDDSLNSSKKPPMNRAQRRSAQRGARRPKKR